MKRRLLMLWLFWWFGLMLSAQGLQISHFELQGEETDLYFAGDEVSLNIEVLNADVVAHEHCAITVFTADSNVTFLDDSELFDYIGAGNSYLLGHCVTFQLNPATPDRHVVTLMLHLSSDNAVYDTICTFLVHSCQMQCLGYKLVGENSSLIHANETDSLIFTLRNQTYRPILDVDFTLTVEEPGLQVLSGPLHVDTLTAGDIITFPSLLHADQTFLDGTTFDVIISIEIEGRQSTQLRTSIVGVSNCEEFDAGMMPATFQADPSYFGWQVDSSESFVGHYSLISEPIGHNDTCKVSYSFTTTASARLSFAFKTSTENNYDWLYCYVDSVMKNRWSGESEWTEVSYELSAGTHIVSWYYIKDYSQSVNRDCVWIDKICLSDYAFIQPAIEVDSAEIEVTLNRTNQTDSMITLSLTNSSDIYLLFDNELQQGASLPGWVTVTPPNGSVNAHATRELYLLFSAVNQLPGDYHAELKLHNSTENSEVTIPLTLHILSGTVEPEYPTPTLSLYPNPTNGWFHLSCSDRDMDQVTVYDAFGRQLLSEKIGKGDFSADIRYVDAGVYFVEVQCGRQIFTLKVIKQ